MLSIEEARAIEDAFDVVRYIERTAQAIARHIKAGDYAHVRRYHEVLAVLIEKLPHKAHSAPQEIGAFEAPPPRDEESQALPRVTGVVSPEEPEVSSSSRDADAAPVDDDDAPEDEPAGTA